MKPKHKKSVTLPNFNDKFSYASRAIDLSKKGCYDGQNKLRIDEGYGDFNMSLFRLKNRKGMVRDIPTAFTPTLQTIMQYKADDPRQQRIAEQHNQQIRRILSNPKELYIDRIRKEKKEQQAKHQERMRMYEFIKGQDNEVRQYNQHLSFNYLTKYLADRWFKIKDKSSQYLPPYDIAPQRVVASIRTEAKEGNKLKHLYWSGVKPRRFFKRKDI